MTILGRAFIVSLIITLTVLLCYTYIRQQLQDDYSLGAPSSTLAAQKLDVQEQLFERISGNSSHSLTAILPIASDTNLLELLSNLIFTETSLSEVILLCPGSLLPKARDGALQFAYQAPINHHVDITVHTWSPHLSEPAVIASFFSKVATDWILVLDQAALRSISPETRHFLLNPIGISMPHGPRGFRHSEPSATCLIPSDVPQFASYLVPPFVIGTSFAAQFKSTGLPTSWQHFGDLVSLCLSDSHGGIVLGLNEVRSDWCKSLMQDDPDDLVADPEGAALSSSSKIKMGDFAALLPGTVDLEALSPLLCALLAKGYEVHILVHTAVLFMPPSNLRCTLAFDVVQKPPEVFEWLSAIKSRPHALFMVSGMDLIVPPSVAKTVITLSRNDLAHTRWMSALSLSEWQNWHEPQIDISIITHNRPPSLSRLLDSVSQGIYFGDTVNLRVHMDQTSDFETLRIVDDFRWKHGSFFAHHRVIHGGLLPAVVESWYPHTNDSYGILLEDDVEVSPHFYTWVKMCILRYRYGRKQARDHSAQVFGISLYQQKILELKPEGRQPFDPRSLFAQRGVRNPSTPYLSQIPCSWGAVYFPEHWREFHDYLSIRLSEWTHRIDDVIVPDVRSNKWMRSWKKYFIELAYMRGYVMLYPNFEEFVSLSTNHLEVGSHVRERSEEKQSMFTLPLMGLDDWECLDIHLPSLEDLPVLNLLGDLASSLVELMEIGLSRRRLLTGCASMPLEYSAEDLMCMDLEVTDEENASAEENT